MLNSLCIRVAASTVVLILAAGAAAVMGEEELEGIQGRATTEEPVVLHPQDLVWKERATGVRVTVLHGDPAREGPFALRLEYPAGYRKGPHFHPRNAYVTVLSGSYFRAYGTSFDETKGIELTPGTFSVNPGGVVHYEWTHEPASLEVHAEGPWTTLYSAAEEHMVE